MWIVQRGTQTVLMTTVSVSMHTSWFFLKVQEHSLSETDLYRYTQVRLIHTCKLHIKTRTGTVLKKNLASMRNLMDLAEG